MQYGGTPTSTGNWIEVSDTGLVKTSECTIEFDNGRKAIVRERSEVVPDPSTLATVTINTYTYQMINSGGNTQGGNQGGGMQQVSLNNLDIKYIDGNQILYFTNYARLYLNVADDDDYLPMSTAYLIIYIALVAFTAVFAMRYIKRVIYIAFLTLMAPMVALTYPLDKIKDRKSTGLEYVV